MYDNDYIESLIIRHLNGESSLEERDELAGWITESQANNTEYTRIKDIWDSLRVTPDRSAEQLAQFYKNQYAHSKKRNLILIRSLSAVAAVLLIGLVVSVLIPSENKNSIVSTQVYSVPLGSRSKVILADGSEINLNSGSELKYSADYSSTNRVVSLTGEAFFNVKTDPSHPFTVKTADFDIKVTGTKFNVCSYNDNKYSAATLAEGKISLELKNKAEELTIDPGEKFQLNRDSQTHSLSDADVESEIAWKDDQFIFRNIPFPELAKRLERWYDVKLSYSDKRLQEYSFTGKFKNQETIWQVLDALSLTTPISYQKTTFREFTINYKPINNK